MGLGTALAKDGKGDRAERAFRRAVRLQPGYWRAHNSLGWFYMQSGRILEAIDAYTRVTYLAPTNAWGFNNLGSARFASGDFDAAIRVWKRAGELDPESGVLSNMGTAYFYLRDFASAAEMYREALKYAPGDYRLWINLGDALRFVENSTASSEGVAGPAGATLTPESVYRRAINLASAVQSVTPNDTSAISAQALAFAFLGERGQAESMISRAASVESGDAQTLYQLTLTYLLLDKNQDALAWLARAVEAGYPKVYVRSDPLFDPLRGVTEFDALAQDGS